MIGAVLQICNYVSIFFYFATGSQKVVENGRLHVFLLNDKQKTSSQNPCHDLIDISHIILILKFDRGFPIDVQ